MIKNIENWDNFISDFSVNILPKYLEHERQFDNQGIHGRLHISRALIFVETMARFYYKETGIKHLDFRALRYAVSFHDSGRKGNGIDVWENDSARICYDHLINQGHSIEYCTYCSQLIEKKGKWDAHKKLVHDADVLEIMRPCCGHGGLNGFNTNALRFLSNRDGFVGKENLASYSSTRKNLIDEAWLMILHTEKNKNYLNALNHAYFDRLIDLISGNKFQLIQYMLEL